MAFYKVLEQSFIGSSLVAEGAIVDINDDVASGGYTPGTNLAACDADGNLLAAEGAVSKAKPKAAKKVAEPETGGDLA